MEVYVQLNFFYLSKQVNGECVCVFVRGGDLDSTLTSMSRPWQVTALGGPAAGPVPPLPAALCHWAWGFEKAYNRFKGVRERRGWGGKGTKKKEPVLMSHSAGFGLACLCPRCAVSRTPNHTHTWHAPMHTTSRNNEQMIRSSGSRRDGCKRQWQTGLGWASSLRPNEENDYVRLMLSCPCHFQDWPANLSCKMFLQLWALFFLSFLLKSHVLC